MSSADRTEQLAWEEPAVSFSTGMFRPVTREADNLTCRTIFGQLPTDLVGTYYRNGPNAKHPAGEDDPFHYFDGDGMVAAFRIPGGHGGDVTFSHKWVRTERLAYDDAAGKSIFDFGSLAEGKVVAHLPGVMNEAGVRMGKANTALVFHHEKFLALEEADMPYQIHPRTLQTLGNGRQSFEGDDPADPLSVFTAHPHVCPFTGEMVGYSCPYSPNPKWTYARMDPSGKILNRFSIDLPRTSYAHDFGCTRRFAMCFDGSLSMDWNVIMAAAMGTPPPAGKNGVWKFDRDRPGRIGVFPRDATAASQVKWFEVAPFCVSHTACCWEDPRDGDVIVVVTNNIGHESFSAKFPAETPQDPDANLHMYRLRWSTGVVEEERVLWRGRSDFPTTNRQWKGTPRYVYAALLDYTEPQHCPQLFGFYKHDLRTGARTTVSYADTRTCFGGEPLFVPRVGGSTEDDGYVLVLVNNVPKKRTELRIYDAQKLEATAEGAHVATVECPRRITPLGTHGIWLNANDIAASVPKGVVPRSKL